MEEDGGGARLSLPEFIETDWRTGADPAVIEAKLKEDKKHEIKAVRGCCCTHRGDSDGRTCLRSPEIRKAIDRAERGIRHCSWSSTISSLAST